MKTISNRDRLLLFLATFFSCGAVLGSTSGKLGNVELMLYEEHEPGKFLSRAEVSNDTGQTLQVVCEDDRDICNFYIHGTNLCEATTSRSLQINQLSKRGKQQDVTASCDTATESGVLHIKDPADVDFIFKSRFEDAMGISYTDTDKDDPTYSFNLEEEWATAISIIASFHHLVQNVGHKPPYNLAVLNAYAIPMWKMDTYPNDYENCSSREAAGEGSKLWNYVAKQLIQPTDRNEQQAFRDSGNFFAWVAAAFDLMPIDSKLNDSTNISEERLACAIGIGNLFAAQHQFTRPHSIKPDAEFQRIRNNREEICTKFKKGFKELNC